MKIGIVSDTHSNLFALEAVLKHMNNIGVDLKVHLGDIVGFGPKPNETLTMTLENFNYIVMGAGDFEIIHPELLVYPSESKKDDIYFTRSKLSKEGIDILANLRYGHLLNDMLFVHGSPSSYNQLASIRSENDAREAFDSPVADFKVAFVGGTHKPFIWKEDSFDAVRLFSQRDVEGKTSVSVKEKAILNVGSVGQPRDGDPRASYAIYDTQEQKVTFFKVPYEVHKTVASMQRLGFMNSSFERLFYGR